MERGLRGRQDRADEHVVGRAEKRGDVVAVQEHDEGVVAERPSRDRTAERALGPGQRPDLDRGDGHPPDRGLVSDEP